MHVIMFEAHMMTIKENYHLVYTDKRNTYNNLFHLRKLIKGNKYSLQRQNYSLLCLQTHTSLSDILNI